MKKKILLYNAIMAILIGTFVYYIFFPDVKFAKAIDALLQTSFHFPLQMNNVAIKLIRFYLMDFLWAIALISFVLYFCGCNKTIMILVFIFEAFMELVQIFQNVEGTFDVWDIVIEFLANIIVLLIYRRMKNEKS